MKEDFPAEADTLASTQISTVKAISALVADITAKVDAMNAARSKANAIADEFKRALAFHDIADSLLLIRKSIDELEEITDNNMWPLPKYREILFIN